MYNDILASGQVTQLGASAKRLLQVSGVIPGCVKTLVLAAYHTDTGTLVGAIACRLEAHGSTAKMYIITLGVAAPYRGMRVGESAAI